MPTKEELDNLYADSWSAPENARSETGGTDNRLALIYARNLARSLNRRDFHGLRILDFGAGRGAMLKAFKKMGATVTGVEPYGVEYLQSLGFEAFSDLSDISGAFDGIFMNDVFEHLPEPWKVIQQLYQILQDGGWLYVATGNPLGLNARITKGNWREAKKAGHLFWPTPELMEEILKGAGFSQVKRLRWLVRFSSNPIKILLHYSTQLAGLDGELRFLAFKRAVEK